MTLLHKDMADWFSAAASVDPVRFMQLASSAGLTRDTRIIGNRNSSPCRGFPYYRDGDLLLEQRGRFFFLGVQVQCSSGTYLPERKRKIILLRLALDYTTCVYQNCICPPCQDDDDDECDNCCVCAGCDAHECNECNDIAWCTTHNIEHNEPFEEVAV